MSSSTGQVYEPLQNATSIRILLLAPGKPDDPEVLCWLLPCDLDFDHERFPTTTPRPVESISFATGKLLNGETREFPISFDMDYDHKPKKRMHPFQRYEALSYVWGDPNGSECISLDGSRVPVTANLYQALKSLRMPSSGRRLWVDALCINQRDHKEKEVQIGLMRRVYQQAEKVIAYLPLPLQDQNNIGQLVPAILRAYKICAAERERREKEGPGQYTGVFNSVRELKTTEVATDDNDGKPLSVILAQHKEGKENNVFLEDFDLPLEDSPLWDSWRRLFTSPYFRRIWILQEIALAKNLVFWFGQGGTSRVMELIVAHHLLGEYSGAMNMGYMASPKQLSDDNTQDTLQAALAGSHCASRMFGQRLLAQGGSPSQTRLIEKLPGVAMFQATDPRDKIYAVLGLTRDGAFFLPHVSYAELPEQVFFRFAKLFIAQGEGIEVLLQAGLRENGQSWPSWLPHWEGLDHVVEARAIGRPGQWSTRMQVDDKERRLDMRGFILDEIKTLNESVLEKLEVDDGGVSMRLVIGSLVKMFRMAFATAKTRDPEELFERLFQALVQPERLSKTTSATPPPNAEPPATALGRLHLTPTAPQPSSSNAPSPPSSSEESILRTGFHEFLNYLVTLNARLPKVREGVTQLIGHDKPNEFHAFLKRVMSTTGHRRLCVTRDGGRFGVVPKRAEVGDRVVLFEGCDVHFVLRPVPALPPMAKTTGRREVGKDRSLVRRLFGSKGSGDRDKEGIVEGAGRYRLVGVAYFPPERGGEGRASESGMGKITIV